MLRLFPRLEDRESFRILCLGAHSDDIEIGCAGTLIRLCGDLSEAELDVEVDWVVFSATGEREEEARASAETLPLGDRIRVNLETHGFRDRYFPAEALVLKETFDALKQRVDPDVVFTHCEHDRHQDHRTVNELTWNTFRDHLVLEYEIPKYDGDLGRPNVFVPLSAEVCRRKTSHLVEAFPSQLGRSWFDEDTFRGLMRIRGVECAAPDGYAEAFHGRKLSLGR